MKDDTQYPAEAVALLEPHGRTPRCEPIGDQHVLERREGKGRRWSDPAEAGYRVRRAEGGQELVHELLARYPAVQAVRQRRIVEHEYDMAKAYGDAASPVHQAVMDGLPDPVPCHEAVSWAMLVRYQPLLLTLADLVRRVRDRCRATHPSPAAARAEAMQQWRGSDDGSPTSYSLRMLLSDLVGPSCWSEASELRTEAAYEVAREVLWTRLTE